MSEPSERETIIICNRADMAVGYFCLGTSEASGFRKLCRRIRGQDNLRSVKMTRDRGGKASYWACEVPIENPSQATWAIGAKKRRLF